MVRLGRRCLSLSYRSVSDDVGRVFRPGAINGKRFANPRDIMSRPKRIPGYEYVGVQRYFLTICTDQRLEHLRDAANVDIVARHFLQTAERERIAVIVYCVMPDHMHLLVDGLDDGAELVPFVKLSKQKSGFEFKQRTGSRLWQEGYYEHVLRDEERTEDVVFYIIANPVRKGLVKDVMDYPFWGSSVYGRQELLNSIGLRKTSI